MTKDEREKYYFNKKIVTCQECFFSYHIGCVSANNQSILSIINDINNSSSNNSTSGKTNNSYWKSKNISNKALKTNEDFYCDDCQPRPVLGTTW